MKQPSSRNQALLVEAIMEAFATHLGEDPRYYGVMGLLSQLDLEYAAQNDQVRGQTARQQAEIEGLPSEEAAALERWCRHPDPQNEFTPLEAALCVATAAAGAALGADPGSDLEAPGFHRALELLAISREDADQMATAALGRIAEDMR